MLEGEIADPNLEEQRVYDGFVDVIDPAAGTVVASVRFPATVDIVVAPGIVAGVREAPAGWHYLDVWQVRLVRP